MFECPTFVPRPIHFGGVVQAGAFRLKRFHLHKDGVKFDPSVFDAGLAAHWLPDDLDESTPGVGFVIHHQGERRGQAVHYIVLGYWFNRNELCLTTAATADGGATWVIDPTQFSPCVWDLEVVWRERNAYVRHVMSGHPDLDAYLADVG